MFFVVSFNYFVFSIDITKFCEQIFLLIHSNLIFYIIRPFNVLSTAYYSFSNGMLIALIISTFYFFELFIVFIGIFLESHMNYSNSLRRDHFSDYYLMMILIIVFLLKFIYYVSFIVYFVRILIYFLQFF